jgi:outer membrane cobalamin receptor
MRSDRLREIVAALFLVAMAVEPHGAGAQVRPVPLDTLRVSVGSRAGGDVASLTRSVEVIDRQAIARSPARTVGDLLQWGLGVDVMPRSPALVDVAVRGSSFEQVLVLVDGVRVSDAQTGHFDLNLAVPLEQIERIEILRGPASTTHGADAVGGVVQIVTRRGARSAARLEVGSFGTAVLGASHGGRRGGATADLAMELQRSDGHRPGTDYRMGTGRAAFGAPVAGGTLALDLGYAARDFGADGFYGPYPSYERTRTGTASVTLRDRAGGAVAVEPAASVRWNSDDFILRREQPELYRNRHSTLQSGVEVVARHAPGRGLRLAAGAEAFSDRLSSARLGDRSESRGALLAEMVAGSAGGAALSAGLRGDVHEAFGVFVSPSAGVAWSLGRAARARASVGRAFRTPTWTERYYSDPANVGDPDLAPERAWSGEVGLEAPVGPRLRLTGSAFVRDSRDLIDWARPAGAPAAEPWRTRNVQTARFLGLEAEARYFLSPALIATARGTWLRLESAEAEGFTSKYALRPMTESITLALDRSARAGLTSGLRAQRARRAGESVHHRIDGRLSYALSGGRIYLDVQNVTAEVYPDITGAPAPGRSAMLGVELGGGR